MLRKTLKYDLKSVFTTWLIMSVSALALSVICGLCIRDMSLNEMDGYSFYGLSVLGVILSFLGLAAYVLGTVLLVLIRYYQSFFTDEGYLTFTLPVKRSVLFNSKLLNALIWTGATGAVLSICMTVILAIAPDVDRGGSLLGSVFSEVIPSLVEAVKQSGGWTVVYALEAVAIALSGFAFNILLLYFCVTLGSMITKKHKVLATVVIYYAVNSVISVLGYVLFFVLGVTDSSLGVLEEKISGGALSWLIFLTLLLVICFFTVASVAVYNLILGRLRKKLNLA